MTAIHSRVPGRSTGSHRDGSSLRALAAQPDNASFSGIWYTSSPVGLLMGVSSKRVLGSHSHVQNRYGRQVLVQQKSPAFFNKWSLGLTMGSKRRIALAPILNIPWPYPESKLLIMPGRQIEEWWFCDPSYCSAGG